MRRSPLTELLRGERQDGELQTESGVFETRRRDGTVQPHGSYTHRKKTKILIITQQHYLNSSKRNVLNPEFKLK